jgi:hypothetical protein
MNIGTFNQCSLCGDYHLSSENCKPTWLVWCPDRGEDVHGARRFAGIDAEHAAERWAQYDDVSSAEYHIVGGGEAVVCVVPSDDPAQVAKRFRITGEAVPQYSACEVAS